ncbi:MAG TPA: UDP-N-acetylmuramate dehydrogenase, partial [Aggregatilineales bacterium]|nr:UDP-N-acetylmuramate dehydrogenase [Aggregatilineales bacterium]
MAGTLIDAEILEMENDNLQIWSNADMQYDYRYSALKGKHGRYVVISARLQLEAGHDPAELNARADSFVAHRKKTQPPGASLGSMFKNPPGDYAGRLIESAGLKGTQIGGVQVSPVHANFFVNVGAGTASDYNALIDLAQKRVYEQFGVHLELEVERVGDWES